MSKMKKKSKKVMGTYQVTINSGESYDTVYAVLHFLTKRRIELLVAEVEELEKSLDVIEAKQKALKVKKWSWEKK